MLLSIDTYASLMVRPFSRHGEGVLCTVVKEQQRIELQESHDPQEIKRLKFSNNQKALQRWHQSLSGLEGSQKKASPGVLYPKPPIGPHLFADAEGDVAVLDHVPDLALHGHEEEDKPVHEQDWPEDWHIKHWEERHHESYEQRLERGIPAHPGATYEIALTQMG